MSLPNRRDFLRGSAGIGLLIAFGDCTSGRDRELAPADVVRGLLVISVADPQNPGRDVIREHEASVLVPLDLKIGRCSMAVAGLASRQGVDIKDWQCVAKSYPDFFEVLDRVRR